MVNAIFSSKNELKYSSGAKENNNLKRITKGTFLSIILTLILLAILSILLTYTNLKENLMTPMVIGITAISTLIGSVVSTRKIKAKGLLNGGLVGILYILIIYLLSSIVCDDFSLSMSSFILIIAAIFTGMIGGIIGVNFHN